MNKPVVLKCTDIRREFKVGPQTLTVLNGLQLTVEQGDLISIVGSSGSGKTTLLNLLAGLDDPSEGSVAIGDQVLKDLTAKQKDRLRNQEVGFVFQFHHLLPEFTALENVLMPTWIGAMDPGKSQAKALDLLAKVGMAERANHKPAELSGGERQRVAIARALINEPRLVLMDEPTGNLDDATSEQIEAMIVELNKDLQTTFVVVTHSGDLAQAMDKVYRLKDGVVQLEN